MEIQHVTARVVEWGDREDVLRIVLESPEGVFPTWTPGAHVDVVLPDGEARQYSLVGSPDDSDHWVIGLLVERDGRGGSVWIAQNAVAGANLTLEYAAQPFRVLVARRPAEGVHRRRNRDHPHLADDRKGRR